MNKTRSYRYGNVIAIEESPEPDTLHLVIFDKEGKQERVIQLTRESWNDMHRVTSTTSLYGDQFEWVAPKELEEKKDA